MRLSDGIFFDLGGTLLLEIKDIPFQDAAKKELHLLAQSIALQTDTVGTEVFIALLYSQMRSMRRLIIDASISYNSGLSQL